MALTGALNMAINGMMTTAVKTSLTSQNITNADKPGYTRKALQVNYLTTNQGSTPIAGVVVGTQDKFLHAALNSDTSVYNKSSVISASLDYYIKQLGTTAGTNTLSSYMDSLYSSLQYLSTSPDSAANKAQVVATASNLANSLRNTSLSIQDLRQTAEHSIATSVNNINAILDRIDLLNTKIANGAATGDDAGIAEFEDQRSTELQNLSGEMDVQYFYNSNNQVQIYTKGGQGLLMSDPHHLSYTVTNVVNSGTTYPADFSAISLDGTDITTTITGGNLAGNIQLRDVTYPAEQAKLTEFANTLKTQVNSLLNTGASMPPRTVLTGQTLALTAGTPFTATGTIQVAVTDNTGMVVNTQNINLAAMTTVSDVLAALNGVPGVTASLTVDGQLSMTVTPSPNGVSINELNSAVTSSTGQGFGQYFGLNDLLTGTSAEDMDISDYLKTGPQYLAVGALDVTATAGTRGVARGDGSIAAGLSDLLNASTTTFNAAGNFSAQSNSLIGYAQAFMSDAASQADLTQKETDTNFQVYKSGNDLVTSKEGVNVDEETAKLLLQQNQYQAGAQVVKTVRDMLQTLMDAMR